MPNIIQYKYGVSNNLSSAEISNGTTYICTDTKDVYLDMEGTRLELSSNVSCDQALKIEIKTEAEYNALTSPDESTLYIIKG